MEDYTKVEVIKQLVELYGKTTSDHHKDEILGQIIRVLNPPTVYTGA